LKRLTNLILATAILGLGSILIGHIFSISILNLIGIILLSDSGILIGIEAIRNQIYLQRSRYDRRATETYIDVAAVLQGILIILLGLFISIIAILVYFQIGQSIFLYFVRHPGIVLIIIGLYSLLTALSTIIGYVEQQHGPKWNVFLELIISRMMPGIILIVIALLSISLGVIEIAAPEYFDKMGGGLLEILFRSN
jgi:hypothetical protein